METKLSLDQGLIDAVREGRAVLFLGAGASVGATRHGSQAIPLAKELGAKIAEKFLDTSYADANFKTIYDLAASNRSVREVQEFIFKQLSGFEPVQHHLLIPNFGWAGIATTNYDLIIEEAYRKSSDAIQNLIPNYQDGDGSAENLELNDLLYVKLHGCITRYEQVKPPLIASTEQIIRHKDGRSGQFSQFLEWGQTKTLIFAGYGLGDENLRTLVDELVKEGDNRPRHYIVRPGIKDFDENYWRERRFVSINANFEQFLKALDEAVPAGTRQLSVLANAYNHTSFTKFISKSGGKESSALNKYLDTQCEHISDLLEIIAGTPAKFYRGFDLGWYPIANDLDIYRKVTTAVLQEQIIPNKVVTRPILAILKAPAGSGKSIILRRICWDAAKQGLLLFRVEDGSSLNVDAFSEIFSLTNQTVFLAIDDVAEYAEEVSKFFATARSRQWPLVVIGGSRVNEWNMRCDSLEPLVDKEYTVNHLSESEIEDLLVRLEKHDCLGYLKSLPFDERKKKFSQNYERQLLVALHEATENATFREIIISEYKNIFPEAAKLLYQDICALNRFGSPVRAGLISRIYGISFEDFQNKFFAPLEQIIELKLDKKTRDYVYKARHPVIADIVYKDAIPNVQEKYDSLIRIIGKLNASYSYDTEVLFNLIRAAQLAELFDDWTMGDDIYNHALENFGSHVVILHQRGLYEMRLAKDAQGLDRAEKYLLQAQELDNKNRSIKHSLAELSLKRAILSKDDLERNTWLRQAESQAQELTRGNSSYPYHTLAKIAVTKVKHAVLESEQKKDELSFGVLNEEIKNAEEIFRLGRQKFPNDDRLLNEEATLQETLQDADGALLALEKANKTNPRSELIARRLARIYKAKDRYEDAIKVLKSSLELNVGNQQLHFDIAKAILESKPDASFSESENIRHHLQRSFSGGDKNYDARFWYARQLCIAGENGEAKTIFDGLKQSPVPYRYKTAIKEILLDAEGTPKYFYGTIYYKAPTYLFVRTDNNSIEAYVTPEDCESDFEQLKVGQKVKYAIGFSLLGPHAIKVQATLF